MTSQKELAYWHKKLNVEQVLPEKSLRRDKLNYELVCYVNNTIALTLSEYFYPIELFVTRAETFMEQYPDSCPEYSELVKEYFIDLKSFLREKSIEQ